MPMASFRILLMLLLAGLPLYGCITPDDDGDRRIVEIQFANQSSVPVQIWITAFRGNIRIGELMGSVPPQDSASDTGRPDVVHMDRFEVYVWHGRTAEQLERVVPFDAATCSSDPLILQAVATNGIGDELSLEVNLNCSV